MAKSKYKIVEVFKGALVGLPGGELGKFCQLDTATEAQLDYLYKQKHPGVELIETK